MLGTIVGIGAILALLAVLVWQRNRARAARAATLTALEQAAAVSAEHQIEAGAVHQLDANRREVAVHDTGEQRAAGSR